MKIKIEECNGYYGVFLNDELIIIANTIDETKVKLDEYVKNM